MKTVKEKKKHTISPCRPHEEETKVKEGCSDYKGTKRKLQN